MLFLPGFTNRLVEIADESVYAKLGDLWCLGEHRLLCGDSTNLKDVLRLMGTDKVALVATDPPYLGPRHRHAFGHLQPRGAAV